MLNRGLLHDGGVLVLHVHSSRLGLHERVRDHSEESDAEDHDLGEERGLLRQSQSHGGVRGSSRIPAIPHQWRITLSGVTARRLVEVRGYRQVSQSNSACLLFLYPLGEECKERPYLKRFHYSVLLIN